MFGFGLISTSAKDITFLIVIVIGIRVGESTFDTNNFSDGYTLTCISSECKQTIFNYGQLTFYQHFVSIYFVVVRILRSRSYGDGTLV